MLSHLLGLLVPAELSMMGHHLGYCAACWARKHLQGKLLCQGCTHCSAMCAAAGSGPCMGRCLEWQSFPEGWLQPEMCYGGAVWWMTCQLGLG